MPDVSIVIVNYNNPEVISTCLSTLQQTRGVSFEVVVVDNASTPDVVDLLVDMKSKQMIDSLVLSPINNYFSEGNNIGVRSSNPESKYILMLNSDVAIIHPDWLTKLVGWMEGTTPYKPSVWGFQPSEPRPGPRDAVSYGWSHDVNVVPGNARPEGWCFMIRREFWQDMSPDFPWHYGFEEMVGKVARAGARIGVLFNYAPYVIHREGGSGKSHMAFVATRQPDLDAWLSGVDIETIDFKLGPQEHSSYLDW